MQYTCIYAYRFKFFKCLGPGLVHPETNRSNGFQCWTQTWLRGQVNLWSNYLHQIIWPNKILELFRSVKSHFYFLGNDKVTRHHCELSKDEWFSKQLFQSSKRSLKLSFPEITGVLRPERFKKSSVYFTSNRFYTEIMYTKVLIFKAFLKCYEKCYELVNSCGVMLK